MRQIEGWVVQLLLLVWKAAQMLDLGDYIEANPRRQT